MPRFWLGVDVGARRKGFDVALIDRRRVLELRGGLNRAAVIALVEQARPLVIGIDSPRSCAAPGQCARSAEREINRRICGIRWTPDREHLVGPYYAWIREGLALFDALAEHDAALIEVFPTASWTRWAGPRGARTRSRWSRTALAGLGLEGVPARTNQDQRDAIAAAVTARLHTRRLTESIGEIVVPALSSRAVPLNGRGRSVSPGARSPRRARGHR